jgi:hypothetical protein
MLDRFSSGYRERTARRPCPKLKQPVDKSENIGVPTGHQEQIFGVSGTLLSGYREHSFGLSGTLPIRIPLIF